MNSMRLILTDTSTDFLSKRPQDTIITATEQIQNCIGCFGCWLKTPGVCVIKDGYENMPKLLAECDKFVVISKITYGGFSPAIKRLIDRSIGYVLPYFCIKGGEMHHKPRYDKTLNYTVIFYGEATDAERATAKKLVQANADNFYGQIKKILFVHSLQDIKEEL
jgi:multimeric flavodoxin WrbA